MLNLVNFNNFNIIKPQTFSGAKFNAYIGVSPLKPLEKDTISFKGSQPRSYELQREAGTFRYFQKFPIGNDNSYKVIYYQDVTDECRMNGHASFPPSHIEFEKPVDMSLGLDICKQNLLGYKDWSIYNDKQFDILKDFLPTCEELKDEKLVSCMDAMHNTIVLELEGNRVLKMVKYNPFPEGRPYEPEFDLPVFSNTYKCGDYYVFVQEKADTDDIDSVALDDVIRRIELAGYEPYDIRGNELQIGWSEIMQDYMLLDTECAVKK